MSDEYNEVLERMKPAVDYVQAKGGVFLVPMTPHACEHMTNISVNKKGRVKVTLEFNAAEVMGDPQDVRTFAAWNARYIPMMLMFEPGKLPEPSVYKDTK